eukprot:CAMPEP_0195528350 /NCGR_PEP_ID=MMETSP0794_2-20130614/30448_1 /TAXON_ID=515487 /ORGANISM="Stephanopyxis turris, Strain CCMP 815" /LENGTH=1203 /DNA_ID=CAMNT_0040659473 /DNA_START=88 /DNA_END=3699 /DNA_ORIENTATION=-
MSSVNGNNSDTSADDDNNKHHTKDDKKNENNAKHENDAGDEKCTSISNSTTCDEKDPLNETPNPSSFADSPSPPPSTPSVSSSIMNENHAEEKKEKMEEETQTSSSVQLQPQPELNEFVRGILYKRRDFFQKQWRPRLFVLNPRTGVLSYYLLPPAAASIPKSQSVSTTSTHGSLMVGGGAGTNNEHSLKHGASDHEGASSSPPLERFGSSIPNTSFDSTSPTLTNPAPLNQPSRGTIYLPGCSVFPNDELTASNPTLYDHVTNEESLGYVLTIACTSSSNSGEDHMSSSQTHHLAVRSEEERDLWISIIHSGCRLLNSSGSSSGSSSGADGRGRRNSDGSCSTSSVGGLEDGNSSVVEELTSVGAVKHSSPRNSLTRKNHKIEKGIKEDEKEAKPLRQDGQENASNSAEDKRRTEKEESRSVSLPPLPLPSDDIIDSLTSSSLPSIPAWYENVPMDIISKIENKLNELLTLGGHTMSSSPSNTTDENCQTTPPKSSDDPFVTCEEWKQVYSKENANAKIKRTADGKLFTIRSDCKVKRVHPHQVLNSLLHEKWIPKIKPDLTHSSILKVYNPHTFIVHDAVKAFWPTSARDYVCIGHWRRLSNGTIVVFGFSHDLGDLSPPLPDHVRADILLGGNILIPENVDDKEGRCIKYQRIVTMDLKGKIPSKILEIVMKSQAMFPLVVEKALHEHEPNPAEKLQGGWEPIPDNEWIVRNLINNIPSLNPKIVDKDINSRNEIQQSSNSVALEPSTGPPSSTSPPTNLDNEIPSVTTTASFQNRILQYIIPSINAILNPLFGIELTSMSPPIQNTPQLLHKIYTTILQVWKHDLPQPTTLIMMVLLLPSFLWYFFSKLFPSYPIMAAILFFCLPLYIGVRYLIMELVLGSPMLYPDNITPISIHGGNANLGTQQVTCRFTIDLRGVFRFINHKREENSTSVANTDTTIPTTNLNHKQAEIVITHIVIKAVARALSELKGFNCRSINIPLLGISGFYPNSTVDVSVASGIHRLSSGANATVKLTGVEKMTIKDIANHLAKKSLVLRNNSITTTTQNSNCERSSAAAMQKKNEQLWKSKLKLFIQTPIHGMHNWIHQQHQKCINTGEFGTCILFTSPNSENSEVDIDVAPSSSLTALPKNKNDFIRVGGANMVVVVGGVRITQNFRSDSARPMLSLSITIDCPVANVATCRKFTERVQNLLRFPEVCDCD